MEPWHPRSVPTSCPKARKNKPMNSMNWNDLEAMRAMWNSNGVPFCKSEIRCISHHSSKQRSKLRHLKLMPQT